jgi:hypothetical protein
MSVARIYGARTASRAYRDRARAHRRAVLRTCLKWLLYLVTAFVLCAIEGTVFAFRGASVSNIGVPYLLPAWVTAAALYEGYVGGAWFGIAAGLLSSAAGGDALYVLPVFYMLYGFSIGMLGGHFLKKGFWFYAVYETAVCMLHGMLLLAFSVISAAYAGESFGVVLPMLWTGILSDMIVSALWCLPLYLPLALIRRITKDKTDGVQSFPS